LRISLFPLRSLLAMLMLLVAFEPDGQRSDPGQEQVGSAPDAGTRVSDATSS
jgi:hypothetical protein